MAILLLQVLFIFFQWYVHPRYTYLCMTIYHKLIQIIWFVFTVQLVLDKHRAISQVNLHMLLTNSSVNRNFLSFIILYIWKTSRYTLTPLKLAKSEHYTRNEPWSKRPDSRSSNTYNQEHNQLRIIARSYPKKNEPRRTYMNSQLLLTMVLISLPETSEEIHGTQFPLEGGHLCNIER